MSGRWSADHAVGIVERVVIEGKMELVTPAHLGDGVGKENTMALLCDAYSDRLEGKIVPLLPGASFAGALRNALREREYGYTQAEDEKRRTQISLLFGGVKGDDDGDHTRLIVDDVRGTGVPITRDGVKIDPCSRTASDSALYKIEAWNAGTTFDLRLELLIRQGDSAVELKTALAHALDCLQKGEIPLGARKRRGYGQVKVDDWRVQTYRVDRLDGLMEWLRLGSSKLEAIAQPPQDIFAALGVKRTQIEDKRSYAILNADFTLDTSLLIRQKAKVDKNDKTKPDFVYLRDQGEEPILSGTSVGGALRARAHKIAKTLQPKKADKVKVLVETLFGSEPTDQPNVKLSASRLSVRETHIEGGIRDQVQSRVSIDRFTGGALDTALFSEQPLFGSDSGGVHICLHLRDPQDAELGLLILLLKDLWTGDLPLGGESSIGRGRLRGTRATLTVKDAAEEKKYTFSADGNRVLVDGTGSDLQRYVNHLHTQLEVEK